MIAPQLRPYRSAHHLPPLSERPGLPSLYPPHHGHGHGQGNPGEMFRNFSQGLGGVPTAQFQPPNNSHFTFGNHQGPQYY